MGSDSVFAAFGATSDYAGSLFFLLWLFVGAGIYFALIVQVRGRAFAGTVESAKRFGLPEAILAAGLIFFLLLNISAAVSRPSTQLSTHSLLANLLFTVAIMLFVVTFLQLRGFDISSIGGFFRISFGRAVGTGAILLFSAYPLIALADVVTERFFKAGTSKQGIVELFSGSRTIEQRIMIIVFAVAIAPVVEEFLFRFFLYGVIKRYFGRFLGITVNALLFAAAHTHLPSFLPLFVLGSCFTIAYEWSGSLLVSMTMHSLFNSLTLVVLAFPEVFSQ
jgi:membrane protease YdiL (CAAX protease family)